ncbi:MAG TPA: MFS transporter [Actinopolymorphaceae bacterium]
MPVLDRRPVGRLYPLTVYFLLDGVLFASWVVRVPAIKAQTDASATALGFALLCMTFGSAVSMAFTGRLCERFGSRNVMLAAYPVVCAGLMLPGLVRTPFELGAVLLAFGLVYGVLLVGLNSAAVEVESTTGRKLMSPLHGLWSAGGLVGAVIGGLLAERLTTLAHFAVIGVGAIVVVVAFAGPMLSPASSGTVPENAPASAPRPTDPSTARGSARAAARPIRVAVTLFGVVALCTAYGEGAIGDWVALHLRDEVGTTVSQAAYGFGVYSVAIALGRLTGGRLAEWVGETRVLTGGAFVAALGVLTTAWTTSFAVALLGLVLVGLGLANMFPIAIARAGAIGGPRGVGLASTIGNTGMLAGPPVIGFLADQLGLPAALSTAAVMAGVAGVIAVALRRHTDPHSDLTDPTDLTGPTGPADLTGHPGDPGRPAESTPPATARGETSRR